MEFITIENKAARVKLDEVVHKGSMDRIKEEIGQVFGAKAFDDGLVAGEITNCIENAADTLDIEIHSPGGSVLDGYTLYNELLELRERGVYVTANITLAASMASVIAMAADKIRMKKGGRMMIHEASAYVEGDAESMRQKADLLESISEEIANIYADRTGEKPDAIRVMMKRETWMNADEAINYGFADEKFDTKKKDKTMNILDRLTQPSDGEAQERIEALENAAQAHEGQVTEFQAKVDAAEAALQEAATEIEAANAAKVIAEQANEELEAKVAELEGKIESLTVEAEAKEEEAAVKVEALAEAAAETEAKVHAKASELVASTGQAEPVEIDEEGETQNKDIYAQYHELQKTDPRAATEFWNKEIAPNLK
jgi:ATP-dependent Clp protease, protease subunit